MRLGDVLKPQEDTEVGFKTVWNGANSRTVFRDNPDEAWVSREDNQSRRDARASK